MGVLPDRIEILSHPGADRSIGIENLKNYRAASRRYRNRRIGEFLKELHPIFPRRREGNSYAIICMPVLQKMLNIHVAAGSKFQNPAPLVHIALEHP